MELKITKEAVLEAASKCSTAKATLKVLFPEAFDEAMRGVIPVPASLPNTSTDGGSSSPVSICDESLDDGNFNGSLFVRHGYRMEVRRRHNCDILTFYKK